MPGLHDQDVIQTSQEVTTPAANPLNELAWMVGDWVDHDEDTTVELSVNWTKNGKFLTRSFRVIPKDGKPHSGMQLIGWDPAEKAIRSWTYDADGGFGEERWRRDGSRWTIRTKYTLPDGERATSTNVMRKLDDDRYTWKSVNRAIGAVLQPDIDEVTVVRKTAAQEAVATPPSPATHDAASPPAEQPKPPAESPALPPPASTPEQETQP